MRTRDLTIRFPTLGVNKRLGYQQQPPYTAADALNVWPDDITEGRSRGGTRPGLSLLSGTVPVSDGAITAMAYAIHAGSSEYGRFLYAAIDGDLYRRSEAGTWSSSLGSSIDTDRRVYMAQQGQVLYIAADTPRFLNLATDSYANWSSSVTDGTLPTKCPLICSWHDRIILAGSPEYPGQAWLSAGGDPLNWLYGEQNALSAVTLTEIEGGTPSDPITALMPHNRHCVMFGCEEQIWILRGDPTAQRGAVEVLSEQVGVLDNSCWCKTHDHWTVFLARDGVYGMAPRCGSVPIPISPNLLPQELRWIDPTTNRCEMAYDHMLRAVHLWITPDSGTATHWLIDWNESRRGFWPIRLGDNLFDPVAVCQYEPAGGENLSDVILGGGNGEFYQFDREATDGDDGNSFESYVVAGPIKAAATIGDRGRIVQSQLISASIGEGAEHEYTVMAGDSAEGAAAGDRTFTVDASSRVAQPRLRGSSVCFKVHSDEYAWRMEEARLRITAGGRYR